MKLYAVLILALLMVVPIMVSAQDIEQRYVTRWNVEPIARLSIAATMEANSARCRIDSEPYEGRWINGRTVGNVHGGTVWQIPVGDIAPGNYQVTYDLRTPLGAEYIPGTLRVPQIARHTGWTMTVEDSRSWPQDEYPLIAQDSGAVQFAWDRHGLHIRSGQGSGSPVTIRIDAMPSVPGEHTYDVLVSESISVPWAALSPAGPHIGQTLRYSVLNGMQSRTEAVDLLFVGTGTSIHFGGTIVSHGPGGDDQGPPAPILRALVDLSGLDMRSTGTEWGRIEREDPGDGESKYNWSSLRSDPDLYQGGLVYAHIGLYNSWAQKIEDPERYRELAERFVRAAATEYAKLGVKHFSLGFNEPEMFFRSDKEAFFVENLNLLAGPVREAVPDAQRIAGKFSSGDRNLLLQFYRHGFDDNFDILDIHPYNNDHRTGTSMGEIVLSHDTLKELGMGHKRIYLGEGWGPTRNLHQVQRIRHDEPVSAAEANYHRQFYQNGYRSLITPQMDYSPDWVIGAKYFTLNDNVGGTYWRQAARPVMNQQGEVEYYLIGELRFGHPDTLKAFFCNGGLIDFYGNPKGQWFFDFPPALPEVRVLASEGPEYMLLGEWHTLRVAVTNANPRPIEKIQLGLRSQTGKFDGDISAEALGDVQRDQLAPGETLRSEIRVRVNEGSPGPLRLALEVDYEYDGDELMVEDVVRTEIRLPIDVMPDKPILTLQPDDPVQRVRVSIRNNERHAVDLRPETIRTQQLEISSNPRSLTLAPEEERSIILTIRPRAVEPGVQTYPIVAESDETITTITPLVIPRAPSAPTIDARMDDWPKSMLDAVSVHFGSSVGRAERPADYPFPLPPPVEESAIGRTEVAVQDEVDDAPVFGADAAIMWDDDNLYMVVMVEDETFVQNYTGMEVWRQDSIQIAFDPLDHGAADRVATGADFAQKVNQEYYSPSDYEYALALTSDGPQVSRIVGPAGTTTGIISNAEVAVRHEEGYTIYEAAIPWELLSPFRPDEGNRFRLNILVNNFEGDDRYTLGWSNAIAAGKYPSRFVPIILGD